MNTSLAYEEILYKSIEEYKTDIDKIINLMLSNGERLVFATIAEKSGVTRFVIRDYPELRNYILTQMVSLKEMYIINKKINRAVDNLLQSNKRLTFISIVNKCRFNSNTIYQNQYIKDKIRSILIQNKNILNKSF